MRRKRPAAPRKLFVTRLGLACAVVLAWSPACGLSAEDAAGALKAELKQVPHKIVYETWHENNWELFMVAADGSQPVNLTRTPQAHELYPHVSPDGTKICFVCDEGEGKARTRSIYYMNIDGSARTLVAKHARDACWKADGTAIAYLQDEVEQLTYMDYATKGLFIYDLATGKQREHPNKQLHHLYNICWSPDGKWFVATVHAGMGYGHAILAIEAEGTKVFNLKIPGCRPDISPAGKRIAWGADDFTLCVADLDLSSPEPKVSNRRNIVTSAKPNKIYHIDWSPDGKYVAFSRGPIEKRLSLPCEFYGVQADGWNICVADPNAVNRWVAITADGNSNKEPDWVPVTKKPQ